MLFENNLGWLSGSLALREDRLKRTEGGSVEENEPAGDGVGGGQTTHSSGATKDGVSTLLH